MKKSHWEHINKSMIWPHVVKVNKAIELTTHNHPSDFEHIDCVFDRIKGYFPDEMKQGTSPIISALRSLLFYSMFSGKIFKIAEEFSKELAKVNITVRANCIPADNEIICIELPSWSEYQACYIGTVEHPGRDSTGPVYRRVELQFCKPLSKDGDNWARVMLHFHSKDEIIEEAIKKSEDGEAGPIPNDLLKFVINAYLYIHSGTPDLRKYSPPKKPLSQKVKVQRRYEKETKDLSSLPMIMVGFSFMKPVGVAGHFQGYWTGTGRTSLVILWKDPYLKNVQKVDAP